MSTKQMLSKLELSLSFSQDDVQRVCYIFFNSLMYPYHTNTLSCQWLSNEKQTLQKMSLVPVWVFHVDSAFQ